MEHRSQTLVRGAVVLLVGFALAACGGGGDGDDGGSVTISPSAASAPVGGSKTFTLSPPQSTTWSVNGVAGGNDTVGTISTGGVYTAPAVIPGSGGVTISALGTSSTAIVTIVNRFIDDGTVVVGGCTVNCIYSIVAPDLNGDRFSDLVAGDVGTGTVSVFMRQSASNFYARVEYPVGSPSPGDPEALVAGDFDGGGDLDLAVADAESGQEAVRVRLGDGHGFLNQEMVTPLAVDSGPVSMASGHFDSNNSLDVVVANFGLSENALSILLGLDPGTGAFTTVDPLDASAPVGVVVADFDKDGIEDIAASQANGSVLVFLGVGDGTFSTAQTYVVPGDLSGIATGDFNGDGYPDLAVIMQLSNGLVVLLNKGGAVGTQTFNAPSTPYLTGAEPFAVMAADLNKDDNVDLVVVNRTAKSVTIYYGQSDGSLAVSETDLVGPAPQAVAIGDFNGDEWPDLAVANGGDDTVTILRNRGD